MAIQIPSDLKVLGNNEFKSLIQDMAETINEMSSTIADLQRVRAMSPRGGSSSAKGRDRGIGMFLVGDGDIGASKHPNS